ncbi:MAG: hypothetical protein JWP81_4938 [Ferruginibacter sp.]|nr:hypothetical protein [Ferruginibacter sp.]
MPTLLFGLPVIMIYQLFNKAGKIILFPLKRYFYSSLSSQWFYSDKDIPGTFSTILPSYFAELPGFKGVLFLASSISCLLFSSTQTTGYCLLWLPEYNVSSLYILFRYSGVMAVMHHIFFNQGLHSFFLVLTGLFPG